MNRLPEKWQDVKISDLALSHKGAIKIGPFGSQLKQDEMVSEGIRVLGQENIIANNFKLGKRYISIAKFQQLKSCQVFPGDVLVSMMGTIGLSRIVPDGFETAIMDSHLIRIQVNPNIVDKDYFCKVLHEYEGVKAQINRNSQGGIMSGLNSQIINSLSIIVPPLPEQRKIAAVLSSADRSIAATEKLIAKLADLKKALMQQLLTKGIGHTEFKPSPLGPIPKNWEVMELNNLAVKRYGIVDGPFGSNLKTIHYRSEGIPIIQSGFVASNYFKVDKYLYVDIDKFNEQKRSAVHGGDIVMAKIGANCGGCAILPHNHPESILAGNSLKITPDNTVIKTEFLLYLLHYLQDIGVIDCIKTVTAQPAISLSSLKTLDIPVPPMSEQNKIAGSICTVDRKLAAAKVKLAKAKDLKQGLMNDLLTGKVRVKA